MPDVRAGAGGMSRPLDSQGRCACSTCTAPVAAVAADTFRCSECNRLRVQPPAAFGCRGGVDGPTDPLCTDCARVDAPRWQWPHLEDGGAA